MINAIHHDESLEEVIKKAQSGFGHIMPSDLWLDSNSTARVFGQAARDKLIAFQLIEEAKDKNYYILTNKGWLFKNFKDEYEHPALAGQSPMRLAR